MSLNPFRVADPSNILAALYQALSPEQVISLFLHCDARSPAEVDRWLIVRQVLAQPAVYEAFGISSLPQDLPIHSTYGLEVIGTLANLLNRGGCHGKFVNDVDSALAESRSFLDGLFSEKYDGAIAYSAHGAWCKWFIDDAWLAETILIGSGKTWWLLAVTDTD